MALTCENSSRSMWSKYFFCGISSTAACRNMPLLRVLPASVTHLIRVDWMHFMFLRKLPGRPVGQACSAVNIAVDNPDLP